jgi:hypothetical protein
VRHGPKGFEFRTGDNKFLLHIQPRVQLRFTDAATEDPAEASDIEGPHSASIFVRRARLKVGGHAFQPWLAFYFEYELASASLLDFKVMVEKWPGLRFKAGQWKVDYSRERVISSGEQQMTDRSLINGAFTLDRQQGAALYGRLEGGGPADLSWWLGAFTGMGRGENDNDDGALLWTGRLQWNPLGRVLDMTGSDLDRREKPELSIAVAGATNRSPYTRFSQSGGGDLPGFDPGTTGQYRVKQGLLETAFMYGGFSWQQELHSKSVEDRISGAITRLSGYYVEAGYFFSELLDAVPKPLELAARVAVLDPDRSLEQDTQRELGVAANWFFHGHHNKLTAEYSRFRFDQAGESPAEDWRFRLQWDISF